MKKLIFIDNDHEQRSKEDLDYVQMNLDMYGGVNDEILNGIETISDFHRLSRDEQTNIVSNPENVILTWSMYTSGHFNSLGQFMSLMKGVGRYGKKGLIYVDCSGELLKSISNRIYDTKDLFFFLKAIENNYIITYNFDSDEKVMFRVRVDFEKEGYGEWYSKEEINLSELISSK